MLVITDSRFLDIVMVEQLARLPRILAGDQVHLTQHADRAVGNVFQIADGGRDHIEAAGHILSMAQFGILEAGAMMTATLPTQEQVDRVARDLAPDVVRIRLDVAPDWTETPSLYFRVILSDEASRREPLREVTGLVRRKVAQDLRLEDLDMHPYFRFRT